MNLNCKNSNMSLYHAQPKLGPPSPVHLAPTYHHNQGFEAEENGKTDWVAGIRKTSYEKNVRKVGSSPRKMSSGQPQGSGASAYQAESRLRRRSTVAKVSDNDIHMYVETFEGKIFLDTDLNN